MFAASAGAGGCVGPDDRRGRRADRRDLV